jgi:ribonuclease HII
VGGIGTAIKLRNHPGAAGLDEAGRGPLAGPVVAAAVVLPKRFDVSGINDSKKLTAAQREALAVRIREKAYWAVVAVDHEEIDRLNILWASMEAMKRALSQLPSAPDRIFVDGHIVPRGLEERAKAVVKGDGKIACIAAASILAKVERDRLMVELAKEYPQYGFDKHFGYSTPEHLEALRLHGPCVIHRRSFTRIQAWEQGCLTFDE